jgi:lipopolysaccharide assembly protein A
MRYFWWVVKLLLFLVLLSFALKNTAAVTVRYYLGLEWEAPLAVVILLFFTLGVGIGLLAAITTVYKTRRQVFALRRELRLAERVAQRPVEIDSSRIADQS